MENLFESAKKDITRLVVVRHGRTNANKEARIGCLDDIPLDELGEEQAKKTAIRLEEFDIDAIYSSPIQRAMETAHFISNHLNLSIIPNDCLKEYNFGVIGNRIMTEIKEEDPNLFAEVNRWIESEPDASLKRPKVPGSEDMAHFAGRINTFCDYLLDTHPGQTIAVVTHMAVIKGLMSVLFKTPRSQHLNFNAFNASITIIDFYKKNPVLTAFNDIHHLGGKYTFGRVNLL